MGQVAAAVHVETSRGLSGKIAHAGAATAAIVATNASQLVPSSAPQSGVTIFFVVGLLALALILLGTVLVPVDLLHSETLFHVRRAYGSVFGALGVGLLLLGLATLVFAKGG